MNVAVGCFAASLAAMSIWQPIAGLLPAIAYAAFVLVC
jgi:hypothetical protein